MSLNCFFVNHMLAGIAVLYMRLKGEDHTCEVAIHISWSLFYVRKYLQNHLAQKIYKTDFIIFKTLLNTGLLHPAELLQGFSSNLVFHKVTKAAVGVLFNYFWYQRIDTGFWQQSCLSRGWCKIVEWLCWTVFTKTQPILI